MNKGDHSIEGARVKRNRSIGELSNGEETDRSQRHGLVGFSVNRYFRRQRTEREISWRFILNAKSQVSDPRGHLLIGTFP